MQLLRRNNLNKCLFMVITAVLFFLTACSHNEKYSSFYSFPQSVWYKDTIARFEVHISDTLSYHDVFIDIRNTNDYPYKNLWLFVSFETPSGQFRKDTLECLMADDFGKWYGKGISLYELSVPYEQKIRFPHSGVYTYSIQQGMRNDLLEGINDVGIRLMSNEN